MSTELRAYPSSLAPHHDSGHRGAVLAGPSSARFPLRNGRAELSRLVGSSSAMQLLRRRIERVAATDFTVLIEGESGTGKELVARHIHALGPRRAGPFVALNCAAIVDTLLEAELFGIEERTATGVRGRIGKFEQAHGGTLFLDEVADLSGSAQAKLLRALQDLTVERVGGHRSTALDLRVLAATNRPLCQCVSDGTFRADLYYRLSGVELEVPPLRSRREDIPELVSHLLARYGQVGSFRVSPAALDALLAHDWPGNVRELERALERGVALGESDEIQIYDLPPAMTARYRQCLQASAERGESMRDWASRYARLVLTRERNNKQRTCEVLGITYHTLQSYLRHRPAAAVRKSTGGPAPRGGAA